LGGNPAANGWIGLTRPVKHLLTEQRIRYAGLALTGLAICVVVWSIYTSDLLESDAWMTTGVLVGVFIAGLIFSLSLCCVFAAWYLLVMSVSTTHISWLEGFCIYSVSQIYKYIPSNVVHHIGRYYMLRRRGVDHAAAAWGFVAETASILIASTLVALSFGAPLIRDAFHSVTTNSLLFGAAIAGCLALVAAGAAYGLRSHAAVRDFVRPFLRMQVLNASVGALLFHIASRVVSGLALWWLATKILGPDQLSVSSAIAVWAAAWTLGYVTPGATAGFGVREAALIASLVAISIPIAGATLVAMAFRVATTFGDLVFSSAGWLLQRSIGSLSQSNQSESL
jgi:hypothetical protein